MKNSSGSIIITQDEITNQAHSLFEAFELKSVESVVDRAYELRRMCYLTKPRKKPDVTIEKIRYWKNNGFRYADKKRQRKKNIKNWRKHLLESF